MKKVYIFLADGFETIEAMAPVDMLRRCKIDIKTVSISDTRNVVCSHGVPMVADMTLKEAEAASGTNAASGVSSAADENGGALSDGDMIILPGGYPGYENLANSDAVGRIVKQYYAQGKWVAAICGAPAVLARFKIATGSHITCHTSVKEKMGFYIYTGKPVEQDENLITGIGAGLSIDFAMKLVRVLTDEETVKSLKRRMEIKN